MRISACGSLIYIIMIIFQLMKMMYDSCGDTFSIMEGRNSEPWQSIVIRDHFIYVDGSIIGQPYLTEPMGEPSAWAVLGCWLFAFIAVQQFAAKKQQIL